MENLSSKPLSSVPYSTADLLQGKASNPEKSVWVAASAGTGKTKVLTDRVLRLLLPDGRGQEYRKASDPDKILCITFTTAAAAEMEERIHKVLSEWTQLPDDALYQSIEKLVQGPVSDEMMQVARRLFAKVVDTPGGMKIMTIHAFCQSVLKRFPIEAGLNPAFNVIDERRARELLTEVMDRIFVYSTSKEEDFFTKSALFLSSLLNEDQFQDTMKTLIHQRTEFRYFLEESGGLDGAIDRLYKGNGFEDIVEEIDLMKSFMDQLDISMIKKMAEIFDQGSKGQQKRLLRLQPFFETKDVQEKVSILFDVFLTKEGNAFSNLLVNDDLKDRPHESEQILKIQGDVVALLNQLKSFRLVEVSSALVTVGNAILSGYQARKKQEGLLDYDDLIDETASLMNEKDQSEWVLYKLDGGIDHILVDEAQDTSPSQWRVIQSLTDEFFSGQGRKDDVNRTLFVVGDEKQSIYSFQKADPYQFVEKRRYFQEKVNQSRGQFEKVDLTISFRSTSAVLSFVDHVFANESVCKGVSLEEDVTIQHDVFRQGQAGRVELWPSALEPEQEEIGFWKIPKEPTDVQNANVTLAKKIASTLRGYFDQSEILPSEGRPIKPSDVMILLRKRGSFMTQIVRALKNANIPVAGVDRLSLKEEIVVMDMMAFASLSLLKADDLTLACVLKSPLVGLSEDELMSLAINREESLWQSLKNNVQYKNIYDYLSSLLVKNKYQRPYEFFSRLLNRPCPADTVSGKKALLKRLGQEALDPIEEFINLVLSYEQDHVPSLQHFLQWFDQDDNEIKRQMDQGADDVVRVMTVHGSKGLQSPIVIMADAANYDIGRKAKNLLWHRDGIGMIPLWAPKKDFQNALFQSHKGTDKEQEDNEYRRLLYVGLTRARDRLIICGSSKKEKAHEKSWYQLVGKDFVSLENTQELPWNEKEGLWSSETYWVLETPQEQPLSKQSVKQQTIRQNPLPQWVYETVEPENQSYKPLTPSKIDMDDLSVISPLNETDQLSRFERGILIHKLLQFLPEIGPDDRLASCTRFVQKQMPSLSGNQVTQIVDEVMTVLNDPVFAPVFSNQARAEVSLTGMVGKNKKVPFVLSGQVDRLLIEENRILIVDYKTNRPSPDEEEKVPAAYLKQMAAYRAVLADLYPEHEVKCALLWTDQAKLMLLSSELLDAHAP